MRNIIKAERFRELEYRRYVFLQNRWIRRVCSWLFNYSFVKSNVYV